MKARFSQKETLGASAAQCKIFGEKENLSFCIHSAINREKLLISRREKRNKRNTDFSGPECTQAQTREVPSFKGGGGGGRQNFLKSIGLENSLLLEMKELNIHITQNNFLGNMKSHLKYTILRKNITFIREADMRVQLKDASQSLFS